MSLFRRRIRIAIAVTVLSLPLILLHACVPSFRMSSAEVDAFFAENKIKGTQHHYTVGSKVIHYVKAGDATQPLVLFVHGSPGSLSAFIRFLADTVLLKKALLISTDRPGFGHSNFGTAEPSLEKQALALKPILEQYKSNRPIVLVGHSLGGPLIVRMAMTYPELVDGLIIVAGSVDPDLEPNETWFRAPLATPFLSWILPRSFRASNEEIYQLKPELQQMLPYWKNITCPVIVIHGKKDELVPFENIDFAKKMLVNAPVEFMINENMNHFVPWSNPEMIREAVIKMVSADKVSR
ncbi:alpha/beta hydrolase [Fulvivirgaceae bacterium PWU4]|uniref:Alpha/beta hydrolase n=1 Tax=Chryseosolibacter histidini TaxID=2782349 RepID=A0AAP2DI38_9BACT|nr:alpha/beta hydrolase [Chryseosolibacter histidini]MBT1695788.1 alpha/beta hydrolase [Chryseosolibacter histidini]